MTPLSYRVRPEKVGGDFPGNLKFGKFGKHASDIPSERGGQSFGIARAGVPKGSEQR